MNFDLIICINNKKIYNISHIDTVLMHKYCVAQFPFSHQKNYTEILYILITGLIGTPQLDLNAKHNKYNKNAQYKQYVHTISTIRYIIRT